MQNLQATGALATAPPMGDPAVPMLAQLVQRVMQQPPQHPQQPAVGVPADVGVLLESMRQQQASQLQQQQQQQQQQVPLTALPALINANPQLAAMLSMARPPPGGPMAGTGVPDVQALLRALQGSGGGGGGGQAPSPRMQDASGVYASCMGWL